MQQQLVVDDIAFVQTYFVNAYMIGASNQWALVDTGIASAAGRIERRAVERFGTHSKPGAIILTHGHFDHVGNALALSEHWDVPIYAHSLELPYLTGRSNYPPPDPTVGGGAVARTSFLMPTHGTDLGRRVHPLPPDHSVPHMPGWRWLHTPGHSPGHVSLYRDQDGSLLAGDALSTVHMESFFSVLTQAQTLTGPPPMLTMDWQAARESVRHLATLEPQMVACGHGLPISGPEVRDALHELSARFDLLAMPKHGRYVGQPAVADESGLVEIPPCPTDYFSRGMLAAAAAFTAAVAITIAARRRR